ncbi:adenine phosphoribosyltransferase [candidate division KSB1 bacterium RBG_16_48_16]|nr:MAG: adenine phosphoribosyltransferase [candidate division KSB1 bacterium RBG_16_48_16]
MDLQKLIRTIPDFPKEGISFKDITPLIGDGPGLREAVRQMKSLFRDDAIDAVLGIESRGFIFASILAYEFGVGLVPIRKPGKLPYKTISQTYQLEYGTGALEIHADAIRNGQRILIVDDLLATGGTVLASAHLVEELGAIVVGCCFLVELDFLHAREKLGNLRVESLIHF